MAVCICPQPLEKFNSSDTLGSFVECLIDSLDAQGLAGYEKVMLMSTLIKSTLPLMQLAGQASGMGCAPPRSKVDPMAPFLR